MEWISVNDRLPDPEIDVLIFDGGINQIIVANCINGEWSDSLLYEEVEPTHWMSLPEPPK